MSCAVISTLLSGAAVMSPLRAEVIIVEETVAYEEGQRLDWIVDYVKEDRDPEEAVVVDLHGPHELLPGTIEMPRGWSVEFSRDGITWDDDDSGEISHLRFLNDDLADDGTIVDVAIPQPVPQIATASGSGDGYIPILAGDRLYATWHHMPASSMVCIDTRTGAKCPGYPKALGMQSSYNTGQGFVHERRIYTKNRDATTHGVLCWSLAAERSCGYTPIATLGPVTGTAGGEGGWDQFSSPVRRGDRLYFAGHDHRVYCFDMDARAICAGYDLDGRASARDGESHVTTRRLNDVIRVGEKMIFSLATSWADGPVPLGAVVHCFDMDADAPCAGFGTSGKVTENSGTAYIFPRLNASGDVVGYCHGVRTEAVAPCYDLDGSSRSTIAAPVPFRQFRPYNVEEAIIGTRMFVGRYSDYGAYCYDWATAAPCTGAHFDANGRSGRSLAEHFYGFVTRGQCVVGLGHKGIFMSVDPETGAVPCREVTDTSYVASAASRYCANTRRLDGWRNVRLAGADPEDFSVLELTVSDGITTKTESLLDGRIGLRVMDTARTLRLDLVATVRPGASSWDTGDPRLELVYDGSHQFCFRTKTVPLPPEPVGPLVPQIIVTDTDGDTDSAFVISQEFADEGLTNEQLGLIPAVGWSAGWMVVLGGALVAAGIAVTGRRRRGFSSAR
jgi:hypothetical protein